MASTAATPDPEVRYVELREYAKVLRRRWQLVLTIIIIGAAAGVGITLATTKIYQANVKIFVGATNSGSISEALSGNNFTQDRVQSYTSIATAPIVTSAVIDKLKLNTTPERLASHISATAPTDRVLITLSVTDTDPSQAARLANAVAAAFDTAVEQTEQVDSNGVPVVKLTVIQPAVVPETPIKPRPIINIGLGLLIGIVLGVGIALARDLLDNTIKGPEDFAAFDLPILSVIPYDKRTVGSPIAFRDDMHSGRSEAYRQLRTNLQFVKVDSSPRIIAVTSAVPGEGKTTTALNLAAALAEGGYRVCLIEADLRRPTLAKVLGLVSDVGFTTTLIGKAEPADVMQSVARNLAVLTSGPVPPNPSELLITEQARLLIAQVASLADYTIIDTAPLLPVVDGAEVAALADATVVVHHAGKSTKEQVRQSLDALAKVGERPVGAVLNRVTRKRGSRDYYYSYSYNYRPDRSRNNDTSKSNQDPSSTSTEHVLPIDSSTDR